MFIYNGFLAVSTKDLDYVYYIFYIFSVGLTQVVLFGYGDKYLWPNSSWLSQHCVYLLGALSGLGTIFFVIRFIKIAHYAPTIHKILKVYIALEVAAILLAVLGYFNASYNLINFNAATSLILLVAAIKAARQGFRSAKFFLLAWTIFLVSVTLYAFKDFGILPYNYFTVYALPFGSAIEGILLSFALADKINTFKKDKEDSQERMISVMKENQSLIEQQNIKLEAMVHERTQDLERANDDLSATLNDLKMTQKQLLESEKLASLGQMTAGIAHEINNPINFVSSNIQPLKRDVSDILTLLDEYAQVSDLEQMREKLPTLQKRYKDLDIDYLKREIDMLLHGIEEGSRRTAEIVRGLRIFSRMDRDALVTASINECLGSTLVVMKSVTKGEVTLVREMQDDLPAIDCYPGKLNQVFMNIINNAVQATKLPGRTTADRQVTIKTFLREDNVCISVTDNGCGIPEDVRSKIFDPFFTTKGVGEGTGLGLSIAMGIINEHHGRIEVSSEPNKGTEFLIILPRKMAMSKAA
jgi:signal transduction histidine kinase